jgi:hypothetical protein
MGTLAQCGERSVASEGVEGVVEFHLDSDALSIGKHACMESVANAATASWDAHGFLEGVELHPGSTSLRGTQAGKAVPNLRDGNGADPSPQFLDADERCIKQLGNVGEGRVQQDIEHLKDSPESVCRGGGCGMYVLIGPSAQAGG